MTAVFVVLWVSIGALAVTTGVTFGVRATSSVLHRRTARYAARIRESVGAFAAQVGSEPAPPKNRLERRLMQRDLLTLRPNLKGGAGQKLTALFDAFGLAEDARKDLRSRSVVARRRAAEILGAMPSDQEEDALVDGLRDRDRLVRLGCARALAAVGDLDSLPQILEALEDEADHPQDAAGVLAAFGPAAVPALRQVLANETPIGQQRLAARALGTGHALSAIPELQDALERDDPALVGDAGHAIGLIGDRRSVPRLQQLAGSHPTTAVRARACTALGRIEDPAAGGCLVAGLSDSQWSVREAAAQALVRLGPEEIPRAFDDAEEPVSDLAAAHVAGALDVRGHLEQVITRASAGDAGADRFVRRACAGGATVRLTALARVRGRPPPTPPTSWLPE